MELIQKGNSKLSEAGMLMFNLPASMEVCGMLCKNCYAVKEQNRFPTVIESRQLRLEAAKQADFADKIQAELSKKKKRPKYFRVHASGDFFSQDYVNAWVSIAKQNTDIVFYAYTKRKHSWDFSELENLENFVLINSLQSGKINYGPLSKAPLTSFICPDVKGSTVRCGIDCTYCMNKHAQTAAPFFIQH